MEDTKVEEEVKTKRCSKCKRLLPLADFYKDKRAKDGLKSECKACHRAMQDGWYAKNPNYNTDYRVKNKEKIAQKDAEYRAKNKDKIAQKQAQYYKEHKEKIAEYYNPQTHPLNWAKQMVKGYKRMDRERFGDDSKTITAEWFVQNIMYKPCAHCGLLQAGSIGVNRLDNSKPHIPSNCEPCCKPCNTREGVRDQIARGLHVSCKHKKQSFKEFVKEHKAKHKNLT